ncbi:alpha/beta hydrolase [Aestuariicella hydrocarbonica]|uniref:Alpha/beta hydrolase n=1 Tax=Pseudomaricurvus hydrocarbonicus TaxID=1470433 RepID=A0A9E5T528_9GAMM|nr:alpha/beta hydrolase [Aestuariicella hydrocarbonica]NHO68537.1 alpha/beta hydrolase [Aestuariicella hydrocarbonica]
MATYVLVHGGGQGGWCYRFVAKRLREQGHEVFTPTLTGLGERAHLLSARVDLKLHIEDIVKVIEFEDLNDVILVGNRYGGMVITGVADRIASRIANVVYLEAAYPRNGQSLLDITGDSLLSLRKQGQVVDGVELVLWPSEELLKLYRTADPQLMEWIRPKLTPHPWKCFEQKLELANEDAMRQIPQSFIVCSANVKEEYQQILEELQVGRFWEIDSGHDLMMTKPDWVAATLQSLSLAVADDVRGEAEMSDGDVPDDAMGGSRPPAKPALFLIKGGKH